MPNSCSGPRVTEQLTIARLGHRGDGVADTPAGPAFVPYTLPGETVTVEPVAGHPDRRHLVHVDRPSHERVVADLQAFRRLRRLRHAALVARRISSVEARAGGGSAGAGRRHRAGRPISSTRTAQGRRRAMLHARRGAHDVLEVGFTAPRAHHIVAIDRCPILAPGLDGAIPAAWAIAEILKPTNKPLDIQVTATDSGLDVDVRGSGPLTSGRTTALAAVADKHKLARLTRHGELVAQAAQPLLKVGRANVPLPPGAFLQATAEGEATLARLVLDHAGKAKRVADLFCGIGTFALRLAETRARHRRRQRRGGHQGAASRPRRKPAGSSRSRRRRATCSAARSWPPS